MVEEGRKMMKVEHLSEKIDIKKKQKLKNIQILYCEQKHANEEINIRNFEFLVR